jgi:hypothetical protein
MRATENSKKVTRRPKATVKAVRKSTPVRATAVRAAKRVKRAAKPGSPRAHHLSGPSDALKIRGVYRIKIGLPDKNGRIRKVQGDSGWHTNLITNEGFRSFLARTLGALASSSQIGFAALGTGGAPIAADTSLAGELTDAATMRMAVTAVTSSTSKAVTFTFTLNSGITTGSHNISNVGLFAASVTNAGTLFAGNTYTSSALATNQAVNGTYSISFA